MTQATSDGYMLTRLKSNGDYIDSSEVIGGGHGTHNGYRYIGDEIWIYSHIKDYEGRKKLVRFKYTPNVKISYGTYGMEEVFTGHSENPYIVPVVNNKEGLILFRIEYPEGEWSTRNAQNYVEVRKLEDVDNRVDNVLYKIDIPAKYSYFGDRKQPMQGVEFDAETLYWYTGNNNPKDNNYLTAFDLDTGKQLYSTVVNYGGISGIYPGDFSEPEGMQLYYDDETDKKALLIGYSVGGPGNRSHKIYGVSQRDVLEKIKSRGTPVPLTDTGGRTKPLPVDPDNLRLLSKITEPGYYYLYTDHTKNIDDFPLDKKQRDAGWFFQVEPPQANGDVLQRLIRNSYSRNLLTFERFVSKRTDNNGKWNLIYKTAGEWERVPVHINKIADLNIVGLTYYMTADDSKRMSDFPPSKKGISGWIIHVEAGEGGGFVHKVIRNISEVRMEILYKVYHQDGTSSDWWMIPGEKVN